MSSITFDLSRTSREPGWIPTASDPHDALWRQFVTSASYTLSGSSQVQSVSTTAGQGLTFGASQGDIQFRQLRFNDGGGSIGDGRASTPVTVELDWIDANSAVLSLERGWNTIKNVEVSAFAGTALRIENFVDVWVHLHDDIGRSITLEAAKRGEVTTGGGADIVTIGIDSNSSGWTNQFLVDTDDGNDVITLRASSFNATGGVYDGGWTETLIRAGAGDDTVVGWGSDDTVDGGSGYDAFVLRGVRSGYSITTTGSVTTIIDINKADGDDGRDTIINVERIRFRDGNTFDLVPPNAAPIAGNDAISLSAATADLTAALLANDVDPEATTLAITAVGPTTLGSVSLVGGAVVFSLDAASYAALGAGQQASGSFTYTVRDAGGLTATVVATVTVTGVNDAASIAGTSAGAVVEDGALTASDALSVADADAGEARFATPVSLAGLYGSFTFDAATGAWGYALNNAAANVQALAAGEVVTDTLTVSSLDGTATRSVTVTVTGTNDAAVITGSATGALVEDGAAVAAGTLLVTDADAGQARFAAPASLSGLYGGFTFDAVTGIWGYTLNNASPGVEALAAGQFVTDRITVLSLDGTASQVVTVTVTGANDAASITGTATGTVVEDGTLAASGALSVADADAGEARFATPASLAGLYGSFTFDATTGAWGYALANAAASVQALAAGQTATDTLTVSSLDGTASQAITVSIVGANNAASIGGTTTGAVSEDGVLTASGALSVADADAGQARFAVPASLAATYGSFTFDAATGDWGYALANAAAGVQALAAGQTVTDTLTVASLDGTATQAITVTVTGANDPAQITGTATGSVVEDGVLTASGTLTVADADAGQARFATPASLTGTYGSFTFNAATGGWGYTLANAAANVQALAAGQTVTDRLTVASSDGSASQAITISIAGAAETVVRPVDSYSTLRLRDGTMPGIQLTAFSQPQGIGISVASIGDLNGDGLPELLVGAPARTENPGGFAEGGTYVVWGTSSTADIDLTRVAAGTGGFLIGGFREGGRVGEAVTAIGDLNGDGLPEIAVGGPQVREVWLNPALPSVPTPGGAYIVWGKADSLPVDLGAVALGTGGFKIIGEVSGDRAGTTLSSIGDLNGDGLSELLIGAHEQDADGINSGAAYVVWGKTNGATVDLRNVALGTGGFKIIGESLANFTGRSVSSVGDLNGDGLTDFVMGANGNSNAGGSLAGAAYVVWGKANGAAVNLDDVALGTGGFKIIGENAGDGLGWAVSSVADMNGDGKREILVTAKGNDAGGSNAGAAYVIWGKADNSLVNLDDVALGTGGFKIFGERPQDQIGDSIAGIDDLNGDGRPEVMIGGLSVSIPEPVSGTFYKGGAVYVVWGKPDGAAINLDAVARRKSPFTELGTGGFKIDGMGDGTLSPLTGTFSSAGRTLSSIGDLNGDGRPEILMSDLSVIASQSAFVVFSNSDWLFAT